MPYFDMLKQHGIDVTFGQFKSVLLKKLSEEGGIRNLSLRSNYYLAGAAKYYLAGELTNNNPVTILSKDFWKNGNSIKADEWKSDICAKLNALINVLRNLYIDSVGSQMELPEDFGEISIKNLFRKYGKFINKELGISGKQKTNPAFESLNRDKHVGNGYTFEIMYSQSDCQKYERPTAPGSWCITYGQSHYESYIRRLNIHYVIFRMDGWENIERPEDPTKEPNWTCEKPHDTYGNSLIALLQSNTSPEPVYITSRWNHGYGKYRCEADYAYTKEEFQQITGVTDDDLKRIYMIWNRDKRSNTNKTAKVPSETIRSFKYAQMRINGGESIESVFDEIDKFDDAQKISKTCLRASIDINGTLYSAFVDKSKIFFETISVGPDVVHSDKFVKWSISGNKHMIYNKNMHRFASVNGVSTFKYIPSTFDASGVFQFPTNGCFEVKQRTTDIALINFDTFSPVVMPNGECWFNRLRFANSSSDYYKVYTQCGTYGESYGRIVEMVYDLSSGEKYLYDTVAKQFYDYPKNEYGITYRHYGNDVELVPQLSTSYHSNFSNGLYLIEFVPNDGYRYYCGDCVVVCMGGSVVKLGGECVFNNVYCTGSKDFIIIDPINVVDEKNVIGRHYSGLLFSLKKNKYIQFHDKFITVNPYSVIEYAKWNLTVISLQFDGNYYSRKSDLVMDTTTCQFYHYIGRNSELQDFLFNTAFSEYDNGPELCNYSQDSGPLYKDFFSEAELSGNNHGKISQDDVIDMVRESIIKIISNL